MVCGETLRRGYSQRMAQRRVRRDERGARHVQAHHLHEHLVGVGGAIERAGARVMVRAHLGGQQFVARGQPFGIALAHFGLGLVGDAAEGIGPPGVKMMGIWPNDAAPMNSPARSCRRCLTT